MTTTLNRPSQPPVFRTAAHCPAKTCDWVQRWLAIAPDVADEHVTYAEQALARHARDVHPVRRDAAGRVITPRSRHPRQPVSKKPRREFITYEGCTRTLKEWSEFTGLSKSTITTRLHRGWPISRTLTEAVR